MKKMYAAWIFLISVLLVAILYVGYSFIDSISGYQELEANMIEAANGYMIINKKSLSVGETITIKEKELIDAKTLGSMEVDDDICKGYVNIKKTLNGFDYKAYIKCENYETEDYEE